MSEIQISSREVFPGNFYPHVDKSRGFGLGSQATGLTHTNQAEWQEFTYETIKSNINSWWVTHPELHSAKRMWLDAEKDASALDPANWPVLTHIFNAIEEVMGIERFLYGCPFPGSPPEKYTPEFKAWFSTLNDVGCLCVIYNKGRDGWQDRVEADTRQALDIAVDIASVTNAKIWVLGWHQLGLGKTGDGWLSAPLLTEFDPDLSTTLGLQLEIVYADYLPWVDYVSLWGGGYASPEGSKWADDLIAALDILVGDDNPGNGGGRGDHPRRDVSEMREMIREMREMIREMRAQSASGLRRRGGSR